MSPEELRAIMFYLRERVNLDPENPGQPVIITFHSPTEEEMIAAGLNAKGVKRLLCVPWWDEMVTDIIETPDLCDLDDAPQQILDYARDVVTEYIRKRFPLKSE